MSDMRPIVEHTLSNFATLTQIEKWATQARALGFPDNSTIDVRGATGERIAFPSLVVRAYLDATDWPDDPDDADGSSATEEGR